MAMWNRKKKNKKKDDRPNSYLICPKCKAERGLVYVDGGYSYGWWSEQICKECGHVVREFDEDSSIDHDYGRGA